MRYLIAAGRLHRLSITGILKPHFLLQIRTLATRREDNENRTTVKDNWWKGDSRKEEGFRRRNDRDDEESRNDRRGERRRDDTEDRRDFRRDDRRDYRRDDRRDDRRDNSRWDDRRDDRRDFRRDDRRDISRDDRRGERREERREERRDDRREREEETPQRVEKRRDDRRPAREEQEVPEPEKKTLTPEEKALKEKQSKLRSSLLPYFPPMDPDERRALVLLKEKSQLSKHQWILPHQVAGLGFEYSPGELVDVYSRDEILLGQAYLNPYSHIFGRFVSWAPDTVEKLDKEYFKTKIWDAYLRRTKFSTAEEHVPTNQKFLYGRVVNSEGDMVPGLIVERYNDVFVIQTKTFAVDKKLHLIKKVLLQLFSPRLIVERNDFASREAEGLKQRKQIHLPEDITSKEQMSFEEIMEQAEEADEKGKRMHLEDESNENEDELEENEEMEEDEIEEDVVEEGGEGIPEGEEENMDETKADLESFKSADTEGTNISLVTIEETHLNGMSAKFKVDVRGGQKTGYYFDQAFNRSLMSGIVKDKRVLDLYCYVGSWSIFAKKYGAKSCVGVDSSSLAIQYAMKNAHLNEVKDIRWACTDVEELLQTATKEKEQFDVIIVDPPALVPKKNYFYQGFKKYLSVHKQAIALLPPQGGILFSCSCSYHMGPEPHLELLQRAAEQMGKNISIIARGGLPPDHPVDIFTPESDYLTCYVVQVW